MWETATNRYNRHPLTPDRYNDTSTKVKNYNDWDETEEKRWREKGSVDVESYWINTKNYIAKLESSMIPPRALIAKLKTRKRGLKAILKDLEPDIYVKASPKSSNSETMQQTKSPSTTASSRLNEQQDMVRTLLRGPVQHTTDSLKIPATSSTTVSENSNDEWPAEIMVPHKKKSNFKFNVNGV
jgi:hypothetical protein